jgi:hypothetical protein
LEKKLSASLGEEEKTASRFEVSSEMPDDDRQLFADFVTGLQPGEDDSVVASMLDEEPRSSVKHI